MVWKIENVPIRSNKKTKIWVEQTFQVSTKKLVITGAWFKNEDLKLTGSHAVDLDAIKTDGRPHAVAITLDNKLECVPFDEQQLVYLAHLAFVYPETETIRLLNFLEE